MTAGHPERGRPRVADHVVAGCALAYLVWALLPWISIGDGYYVSGSVSGFGWTWLVTVSFVLFVLAAAWALVPATARIRVGVPRAWIPVILGAVGGVCTFCAWVASFSYGSSVFAFLGLLTAVALVAFAALRLLPELDPEPVLPGRLAGLARWAGREAPGRSGARDAPPAPAPDPGSAPVAPGPGER